MMYFADAQKINVCTHKVLLVIWQRLVFYLKKVEERHVFDHDRVKVIYNIRQRIIERIGFYTPYGPRPCTRLDRCLFTQPCSARAMPVTCPEKYLFLLL